MEPKECEEELELIKKARNSETVILEQSPPTYGYDFEKETRKVLEDPGIKTLKDLERNINGEIDSIRISSSTKVFKVGQATPPISNVDDFQGYQKTAKVQIGDLIIMWDYRYVGN